MYRPNVRAILLMAAVLATSACSNDTLSSLTTPTTPTSFTDTFTGTLSKNGAFTHSFTTASLGAVTVTILSLAPTSSQILGLSLGVWNGSSCSTTPATGGASSDVATQGSSITLNASAAGSLCVRLYDVGFIDQPVLYALQVTHP
jgi:hypothetical protein